MSDHLTDLMSRQEALHPDLAMFLEDATFGKVLRHPLVYSVPYAEGFNAFLNAQYEQKRNAVLLAKKGREWSRFIYMYERPYRLMAFRLIHTHMTDQEYWRYLSSVWQDSENIRSQLQDWKRFWNSKRPERQAVMDETEIAALAGLPSRFKIFRGFSHRNGVHGFSWTLDAVKADWFGRRSALFENLSHFHIATTIVDRNKVLAYLTGRNESEIVIIPKKAGIMVVRHVR